MTSDQDHRRAAALCLLVSTAEPGAVPPFPPVSPDRLLLAALRERRCGPTGGARGALDILLGRLGAPGERG